jgi:hypothetical protein
MNIVERAKRICLSPDAEWPVIAGENTPMVSLITGYVVPLAGLSAAAQFIGLALIGQSLGPLGMYRPSIGTALAIAITGVIMAVVGVVVISFLIDALAPNFGAQKSSDMAFKVAAYAATPAWLAGILQIIPALGVLAIVGGLYALYLLYLGLIRLMKAPQDKAVVYTVVVVICAIVVGLIAGFLRNLLVGTGLPPALS